MNIYDCLVLGGGPGGYLAAERAAQRAAGEKHSAAAEAAGNDRLFPIVRRGARSVNFVRVAAEAELPVRAVCPAAARAQGTVLIRKHGLPSLIVFP